MSAELLREAAELLREQAEATDTRGAWEVGQRYLRDGDWIRPVYDEDGTVCEIHEGNANEAPKSCKALAEHIASWHPVVALAVADWLDSAARTYEALAGDKTSIQYLTPQSVPTMTEAWAVARAYLGRES